MKPCSPLFLPRILAACALLFLAATATARAQTEPLPPGVKAHRDLAYTKAGHERHKLDLFVPEKGGGPFPLLVWIHGGGWAAGSKDGCPPLRGGYIERGYAVASINYRLSGHAIFPAQIEDCKAALRWLRAHAKEYNLDPDHIGVWGSSAGGHLVALLGTSGDAKEFDVGEHLDQSSRVQAVSDYYGPTDFVQMDAHAVKGTRLIHDSPQSPESRVIGGPIQEKANYDKVQRANPIAYVSKDDPAFLIVHGNEDPAVPHHQSELLHAALVKAGVASRFITVEGGGHGQGFPAAELNQIVAEFFDRHLKGNTAVADWPAAMTSSVKATAAGASGAPAQPPGAGASRGPGVPWEQVLRSDANRDGKISRDEFRGPPEVFDRLDKNGDAVLTKEEHEAAFPPPAASGSPRPEPSSSTAAIPAAGLKWTAATVAAPDGKPIALLWTAPEGEGPFPVVMFVHGAPGGISEAGLRGLAGSGRWPEFAKRGFIVCLADYRGHPDDKPFAVLDGEVNAADDLAAVVKHLATLPQGDTKRLAIIGGSLGGMSTLEAVTTGKLAPACIVLNAPATFPLLRLRGRPERGQELTERDFDKEGALARARKVACPVLIVQGTADGLTPLNKTLHALLKEAGKDSRLELFDGQGHSFANGPDTPAYRKALEQTVEFVSTHTGRAGSAATGAQTEPRSRPDPLTPRRRSPF